MDSYLSAKKDIKYLEDKYDDFILRSLQIEFDKYKQCVDINYPISINSKEHWMLSSMRYNEFTLNKKDSTCSISVNADFNFDNEQWVLKDVELSISDRSSATIKLDKNKLSDIIFQYFIYWQLKEIEKKRDSKKESFQKMIDIIGKDVKRDTLIDKILS